MIEKKYDIKHVDYPKNKLESLFLSTLFYKLLIAKKVVWKVWDEQTLKLILMEHVWWRKSMIKISVIDGPGNKLESL